LRRTPAAILAALTALNLINYVDRYMTAPVLPLITKDFHLTGLQGGLLGSVFMIVYVMVAPVAGWMADHRPRLRLAAMGILVWSVATACSGLAPAYAVLLLARAASGVGEATYAVVTPSLLSDSYPVNRRAKALAIFFAALPVGTALAYVVGGGVGARYGWRAAYFLVCVPAVILCVLLFLLDEPRRGAHDGGVVREHVDLKDSLRALGQRHSYLYNTAAQAIFTFTLSGMALWVPTFLTQERGIPLTTANTTFGILLVVAGIGGTVIGGQLGDALARRYRSAHFTFSAVATLVAVPLIMIAIRSHSQWVLWPCTFAGLFSLFLITGPLQASMMNVLPANLRGRGVAVYTVVIHLFGDVLSQPIMGLAKDKVGLEIPMLLAILFLAVSGALLLAGRRALARDLIAHEEEATSVSLAEAMEAERSRNR
jgi:predicted MFS family arabinose efflux permease